MMKKIRLLFLLVFPASLVSVAQLQSSKATGTDIAFISDTQQPMTVEKIILKPTNNIKATSLLFSEILKAKPQSLYMLGDVVALGYKNRKWKKVDHFLESCRKDSTMVCGLLGNHDVMGHTKKGERNFNKRFPENVRTGYVSVTDSVAIVLLNSNFKKLSAADISKQNSWYKSTLDSLDSNPAIRAVIVSCHHSPYTNSKIVGSSRSVQNMFVPAYIASKKARLFVSGHCHGFEHFNKDGKDFVVIGGGGGLHQPLNNSATALPDEAGNYKPLFHYLNVRRVNDELQVTSRFLQNDFASFSAGHSFVTTFPAANLAQSNNSQPSGSSAQ